jgi:hypothetical protein
MIQSRADFEQGRVEDPPPATVREILLLLLAADQYPILGNHDWTESALMEKEALARAESAVAAPDDPPEFAVWLEILRRAPLPNDEREAVYYALHDYFEPEVTTEKTT